MDRVKLLTREIIVLLALFPQYHYFRYNHFRYHYFRCNHFRCHSFLLINPISSTILLSLPLYYVFCSSYFFLFEGTSFQVSFILYSGVDCSPAISALSELKLPSNLHLSAI